MSILICFNLLGLLEVVPSIIAERALAFVLSFWINISCLTLIVVNIQEELITKIIPKKIVVFNLLASTIEVLSYFIRFLSLRLRIFLNILVGKILTYYSFRRRSYSSSIVIQFLLVHYEIVICILQGFIMFILIALYLREVYPSKKKIIEKRLLFFPIKWRWRKTTTNKFCECKTGSTPIFY